MAKKLIGNRGNSPRSEVTVKDAALDVLQKLPRDCTWEEVMERIYVRQKIEAGLRDAAAGRLTDHDEVFAEFEP